MNTQLIFVYWVYGVTFTAVFGYIAWVLRRLKDEEQS